MLFKTTFKTLAIGLTIGLLALGISVAAAWRGDDRDDGISEELSAGVRSTASDRFPHPSSEESARVEPFCGDCHAVPSPINFSRNRWPDEIKRGYEFYARSGRTDLDPPPPEVTLRYYLAQSPQQPEFDPPPVAKGPWSTKFRVEKRVLPPGATLPEVSTLIWTPLQDGGRPMLVAGDMKFGQVVAIDPTNAEAPPIILARLEHPARIHPVRFSGDGSTEFLVADLGSYMPTEE